MARDDAPAQLVDLIDQALNSRKVDITSNDFRADKGKMQPVSQPAAVARARGLTRGRPPGESRSVQIHCQRLQ